MLEGVLGMTVLTGMAVWLWSVVVRRMGMFIWQFYRITGFIGSPIREAAHYLTCVAFKMKVVRWLPYAPNPLCGTLGSTKFLYSPHQPFHAIGRAAFGIAPMISSVVIMSLIVDPAAKAVSQPGMTNLILGVADGVLATLISVGEMMTASWAGVATVLLLSVVALHLIPIVTDFQITLAGVIGVLCFVLGILLGVEALYTNADRLGLTTLGSIDLHYLLGRLAGGIEGGIWQGLLGVTATLVMATIGCILFVGIPTVLYAIFRFINGARGKI